jgi:hypothetical protein
MARRQSRPKGNIRDYAGISHWAIFHQEGHEEREELIQLHVLPVLHDRNDLFCSGSI